ncbi:MAG: hypothetical protein V3U46_03695 [Acidimicrobiia bacterium]
MPEPLIFIGTHAIKPGMLDTAKSASRDLADFLEPNHPRINHFEVNVDDEANEMTVIQIHPDEDSVLFHIQIAGEKIRSAYEFLEGTTKIELYGNPSQTVIDVVNQMSMGAPVRFNQAVARFSRLR